MLIESVLNLNAKLIAFGTVDLIIIADHSFIFLFSIWKFLMDSLSPDEADRCIKLDSLTWCPLLPYNGGAGFARALTPWSKLHSILGWSMRPALTTLILNVICFCWEHQLGNLFRAFVTLRSGEEQAFQRTVFYRLPYKKYYLGTSQIFFYFFYLVPLTHYKGSIT